MNRWPKAVGLRAARGPRRAVAAALATVACLSLSSSLTSAHDPATWRDGRPWTADAEELAHTAKQAVKNGSTDASCTGWRSTVVPPPTIRVLRTRGPAVGTVEEVDFRTYVGVVLRAEWTDWYPVEAQKVGAIAVKQYGWYYTIVYRGQKSATGDCYDVRDDTVDQYYYPEERTPSQRNLRGIAATWDIALRKRQRTGESAFFLTGYRSGTLAGCGEESTGWKLYQKGVLTCANAKMRWEQILRNYLEPKLEIFDPGRHDIVGLEDGDISLLVDASGLVGPRIYEAGATGTYTEAGGQTIDYDGSSLRSATSADMTVDDRDDLLSLHDVAGGGWRIDVAISDGTSYAEPVTWASGDATLGPDATLLAADFDGDSTQDAGLLIPGIEAGTAILRTFRGTGIGFREPTDRWTGRLDLATARAWAADTSGDGRADLVVARDLGAAGIDYLVAVAPLAGGVLEPLTPWLAAPELQWSTTRHVLGDMDRDGRDDLWIATPATGGVAVDVLRARKTPTFVREPAWASTPSDEIAFDAVRLAGADVDSDGRGDLMLLIDDGAGGTRFVTLRPRHSSVPATPSYSDPELDWSAISAY